jgi:hypothetical protein
MKTSSLKSFFTIIAFISPMAVMAQCKITQAFDKINGVFKLQTQEGFIRGNFFNSAENTMIFFNKAYNSKDTAYSLGLINTTSKAKTDPWMVRKIDKGASLVLLTSKGETIELSSLKLINESRISDGDYFKYKFQSVYDITRSQVKLIQTEKIAAIRVHMTTEEGNGAIQDIEVKEKLQANFNTLSNCIYLKFYGE